MGKTKGKRRPSSEHEQTKELVTQRGFKEAHVLAMVNKGQNPRKNKKTKTIRGEKCRSAVSKMQGGIRFVQWRIRRRRIIRTRFWKSLSRNIAFFCLLFFFLSDGWYIQRWSTSCFALSMTNCRGSWVEVVGRGCWLNHEPLSLSARCCLLSGWNSSMFFMSSPGFVLLFIEGLFFVLERFMTTKWIGFESVTTVIECKQKMLSSWNGVFPAKSRWGVNELWGLRHFGDLLFFIKKISFCW